jgi:drug/metabolite transporter (DMT)-like permease
MLAVSSGAIFARLSDAPPLVTAAYRLGLAALVVLPLAVWKVRGELRALSRREYGWAALSGLFLALHFATWISSLGYTSVANSVVLVDTHPIWVALLAPWLARERVSRRAWLSAVLCVVGGASIGVGDFALDTPALFGDALALAGGLSVAGYLLLGRKLRARLSLLAYVTICYSSAAVLLWLVVLALRLPVSGFSAGTWGALWGMALVSQHVGHSGYNYALRFFRASLIAASLLSEPILSALWAYVLFDERLTWLTGFGAGLILAGIYAAAADRRDLGGERRAG